MDIICCLNSLFVLCGFAKMPYGYYMLLRAAVCLTAVYRFSKALDLESRFWLWVYGSIAVLSNTIFPVRLGNKGIWEIINIVTIVFFWIGAAKLNSIAGEKQVARKKVNSGLSWKRLASQALLPSFGTVPPKNAAEQNPENSEKIKWLRPNSSHRKSPPFAPATPCAQVRILRAHHVFLEYPDLRFAKGRPLRHPQRSRSFSAEKSSLLGCSVFVTKRHSRNLCDR